MGYDSGRMELQCNSTTSRHQQSQEHHLLILELMMEGVRSKKWQEAQAEY